IPPSTPTSHSPRPPHQNRRQFYKENLSTQARSHLPLSETWSLRPTTLTCGTYAEILFEVGYAYQGIDMYDSSYPYLQKSLDVCLEHFGEDYLLTTMCLNKLSFIIIL
ncbi:MAG: tetratricopeptide repeat protein, partial [Saprospiraceae bacterium]|nr:tetratricopeptide repeat protein [Saprospiraceae bacterium]